MSSYFSLTKILWCSIASYRQTQRTIYCFIVFTDIILFLTFQMLKCLKVLYIFIIMSMGRSYGSSLADKETEASTCNKFTHDHTARKRQGWDPNSWVSPTRPSIPLLLSFPLEESHVCLNSPSTYSSLHSCSLSYSAQHFIFPHWASLTPLCIP